MLSIAAARLGYSPVTALDVDPAAVEATRERAREQRPDSRRKGRHARGPLPPAEVVVANIELSLSERVAARVPAPVVITSGYLAADRPEPSGLRHVERLEADGWAADRFVRAT